MLFDILIVLLLAFFAWRGAVKGLVLTLCGLAAMFVAFFAAWFISDAFCVPVANIIRPVITDSIEEAVQEATQGVGNITIGGEQNTYTVGDLLSYLKESERFQGIVDFIRQAVPANVQVQGSPVNALAGYLSKGIAKILLFAIVFIGVQVAWFLVSHALDLAFHLPILSEVNLAGGLVIGLVKGVLVIIVLVWLGQMSGVVPAEPDTPILTLFTVKGLGELLAKLPA